MLEVMTPSKLSNGKVDQSLGPGKVAILNPKEKSPTTEPVINQESPGSQSTVSTPGIQPNSQVPTPKISAVTPPQVGPVASGPAPQVVPQAVRPVQGSIPAPVVPTNTTFPPVQPIKPATAAAAADESLAVPIPHSPDHVCSNCGVTDTPLWRRGLRGEIMCNACGLYVKSRHISRPVNLKRSPRTKTVAQNEENAPGTCPGGGQCNGTGGSQACSQCPTFNNKASRAKTEQSSRQQVLISCQNCGTVTTPLWRRDNEGNTICNACGLYLRMHNEHRPVKMVKNTIKRRKRVADGEVLVKSPDAHGIPHQHGEHYPQQHGPQHGPQLAQNIVHVGQLPPQYPPRAMPGPPPVVGPSIPMAMPIDFTTENPTNPQPAVKHELPNYQPLSLLEYLSGDSKKEYLLAVRRQLQDKVSQIEIQLHEFGKQLSECDEALEKLN